MDHLFGCRQSFLLRRLLLSGIAATATVTFVGTGTAFAACPAANQTTGFAYAGQISTNQNFTGLERFVSLPAVKLSNLQQQHIAFWLDVDNFPGGATCSYDNEFDCWVQVGHEEGTGGNGQTVGQLTPYFETNEPNGAYYFQFYSYGLAQNTFYTVFNTGARSSNGQYQFEGFLTDSTGTSRFLSAGYQNYPAAEVQSDAEMYDYAGTYCPTISAPRTYQYFGTNGGGSTSTGFSLDNATTSAPQNWSPWTSGATRLANYEMDYIQPNYAFRTAGGSG